MPEFSFNILIQFLCQENKQRLFEARLEALTFNTIECFNELAQVQPMLEENANIDEVCSAILEKYRNAEADGKKVPNRTMVQLKSQLIDEFFKVEFVENLCVSSFFSFMPEKSRAVLGAILRCQF